MSSRFDAYNQLVFQGWEQSRAGQKDEAREAYRLASLLYDDISLCPELQLLRHAEGEAQGRITHYAPTEDDVVAFQITSDIKESADARGMRSAGVFDVNASLFDKLAERFDGGIHARNIRAELAHLMVISTGRAGTVSLSRLFESTDYMGFHSYLWSVHQAVHLETLARIMEGLWDNERMLWVETRAAEWLSAISQQRRMALFNHQDTVWAPVFALLHPKSRFIWLQRDPVEVFKSFVSKQQWSSEYIAPFRFKFDEGAFSYRLQRWDIVRTMVWYILLTERWCRTLLAWVGKDRAMHVRSEQLWAGEEEALRRLADFTEIDVPIDEMRQHFRIKYTAKRHKVIRTEEQMAMLVNDFKKEYEALRKEDAHAV